MSSNSWLDDFFGPGTPRYGGTNLEKRGTVEYGGAGVSVTDDPIHRKTVVKITGAGAPSPGRSPTRSSPPTEREPCRSPREWSRERITSASAEDTRR